VANPGELVNLGAPGTKYYLPYRQQEELGFGYFYLRTVVPPEQLLGTLPTLVKKPVGVMALVGGAIGLVVAIGVGRLAESLRFEMKGYDPLVIGAAVVALALVARGAGFIPALRASKIDPMNALSYE